MQIMLFGGSFDPPHLGHQYMTNKVLQLKLADQVWYVPCAQHPFAKSLSATAHRLAMLQAIAVPNARIIDYELKKTSPSYSIETLQFFQQKYPGYQFSWLIGSDQLPAFPKWHKYKDLLKQWPVYVYPRQSYPLSSLLPNMRAMADVPQVNIQSSKIRQMITKGKSITSLVSPQVIKYIAAYKLYQV